MKKLHSCSTRLVLADPPYAINVKGATWDKGTNYMGFARAWLEQAARILQPGGTLLYFSSPCTILSSRMNVLLEDELGLHHEQTLTWCYTQGLRHCTPLTPVLDPHTRIASLNRWRFEAREHDGLRGAIRDD